MYVYFITFRSVTFAQRGERVLRNGGIDCKLQRTPRWMEEQGCGYCLVIRRGGVAQAVRLLKQNHVQYRKIYLQGEADSVKEVVL